MKSAGSYEALARLLEYPSAAGEALAHACGVELRERNEPAADAVDAFDAATRDLYLEDLEELYARTFDLDPTHAMDLGWQLFGETYKRGVFLVKMQASLREHGIDQGSELGDHLPLVLRLLARLDDEEDPHGLVEEVILPAVAKLRAAMTQQGQPHRFVLDAIDAVLRADFGVEHVEMPSEATSGARSPEGFATRGSEAHSSDLDASRQAPFVGNRRMLPVLQDTQPEEYR